MIDTITCNRCNGTGRRSLTKVERATLAAVAACPEWSTRIDIEARLPRRVAATALCNRLVALEELGLLDRRRVGKSFEWRIRP